MKTFVHISILVLSALLWQACKEKPKPAANPATNIPIVLEGKHVDVSSLYKRNKEALIESLYQELISKSEELKQLDAEIKGIAQLQKQATDSFHLFDSKNRAYYESALLSTTNIRDSIFRKKVQGIINESFNAYKTQILPHQQLDSLLSQKNTTITDLYTLLKVVKTLPAMHNFQEERLPGTGTAEAFSRQLDSLVQKLYTLTKK
ncbi:MAG: hypothetical protein ACTHMC_14125 [Pseudobacter sp.]|uniref:hypothetical protein n=1 Tax=Pseudobacter sp. TaxID=2045420 RepID=UPI003F7D8581